MSSEPLLVDPDLQKIIRTASAPAASVPKVKPPREMPGDSGFLHGLRHLAGIVTTGIAHALESRARYGDIYRTQLVDNPMVAVWDADVVHGIVQNTDRLWSTALGWDSLGLGGLDPAGGNLRLLGTMDFEDHKAARKLVQPAFTLKAIDGYLRSAGTIFEEVIPGWVARGRIDFKPESRRLLARVATHIFLGLEDPAEIARVDQALADFWGTMLATSRSRWLSPAFRRAQAGLKTLLDTLRALVPGRRASTGTDVFSLLCRAAEPDEAGDEGLVRVFTNIMFGAFDTTAASLTSMAYLLAKHPGWQERLREEHARVGPADMKSLKQTEWVWKETLRLMPMAPFLPRVPLRDVDLGGHRVRAGTLVMPMIGGLGRHPKWWKDPDTFDPERFSPERAEDRQHPAIYLPFGAGAHACVGMQLANLEVKLFWHALLTRCSFTLAKDYEATHTIPPLGVVSGKVSLRLAALTPPARPAQASPPSAVEPWPARPGPAGECGSS
jgi:cytochrome P450